MPLSIMAFAGISALPLYVAEAQGFFTANGIDPEIVPAPNSHVLRDGLADGTYRIVHAAVDNAFAMAEADRDVVAVVAGDDGLTSLVGSPDLATLADIRGGTLVVDAPDTGFALLAYAILERNGLQRERDYSVAPAGSSAKRLAALSERKERCAAILTLPYSIDALARGFRHLADPAESVGPYLANGSFAMRAWARDNRGVVVRYVAAYRAALAWTLAPENETALAQLASERLSISTEMAAHACRIARPRFFADAVAPPSALETVASLRRAAKLGGSGPAIDPAGMFDDSFRQDAA